MAYLDDIAAAMLGLETDSLFRFHVLNTGQVVFSGDMSDYTLTAMCVISDPNITLNSIPDRFLLAATYWVLHRHYSGKDGNLATYYHQLYRTEWEKVSHNRIKPLTSYLGDDL